MTRRPSSEVRQTIERIAPSDAAVLITGEHGTGKEVVATWLHALSDRRSKPLVTMNAGGLAEGIAESELFGHVKGAFTDARFDRIGCFELADEGTLFLDEIANMPVRLQAKLLRVLQTGEVQRVGSSRLRFVNVRVLSATNADLPTEIAGGRFREDLLYRLNTVVIHLPPLRERLEDVDALAAHFLAHYAARYRKPITGFDDSARRAMKSHRWPGNVRELGHAIERAVLMSDPAATSIAGSHLGLGTPAAVSRRPRRCRWKRPSAYSSRRSSPRHSGDVRLAAQQLGMSRSALYRRLQQYGVTRVNPALLARQGRCTAASSNPFSISSSSPDCRQARPARALWGQPYSFEVRWTHHQRRPARLAGRGGTGLPDRPAHAVPAGQPARRAARGRLLDPRYRREGRAAVSISS